MLRYIGGMEDFCKYLGVSRTFSLICCMFWIFSPAEGNISKVAGSKVILHCKNTSNSMLVQLTWKMNEVTLFSFRPAEPLHISQEAHDLNINVSESKVNVLVIENVQKSHTGNYTCEFNTESSGAQEQMWELMVKEPEETRNVNKLVIAVATGVPCACFLVFILVLAILHRVRKQRTGQHCPNAEMDEEDIYENCLGNDVNQRRGYNQPCHYKHRAH